MEAEKSTSNVGAHRSSRTVDLVADVMWTIRILVYSTEPDVLSEFVEDARQHCGMPVKLEPRFVAQPVAKVCFRYPLVSVTNLIVAHRQFGAQ